MSLTNPHPINATGPVSGKICGWNVPLPKQKHIYLLRTWWMRGPHCPPLSPMSSLWCLFINGQIMKEQEQFRSSLKTVFVRFYPPGSLALQNIFKSGSPSSPLILFATHHMKVIFWSRHPESFSVLCLQEYWWQLTSDTQILQWIPVVPGPPWARSVVNWRMLCSLELIKV